MAMAEMPQAIPKDVGRGRSHQESSLPNAEIRLDTQANEARLL